MNEKVQIAISGHQFNVDTFWKEKIKARDIAPGGGEEYFFHINIRKDSWEANRIARGSRLSWSQLGQQLKDYIEGRRKGGVDPDLWIHIEKDGERYVVVSLNTGEEKKKEAGVKELEDAFVVEGIMRKK